MNLAVENLGHPGELKFVADFAQELFAPGDAGFILHALAFAAVDDAEDAAALRCFSNNHFDRVRRSAVDAADFRHHLDNVEYTHREISRTEKHDKAMTGGKRQGVALGQIDHRRIRAAPAHQHGAGRFAEADAELDSRNRLNQGLVNVLDSLDEVALAEDEIDVIGLFNGDGLELQFTRPCGNAAWVSWA